MSTFCKKHNRAHTPSFDLNNTFCFECENEPKGTPTKNADGFRITAAPVGIDDTEYFSVLEVKDWGARPQYCYLFKTQAAAKKELDLRAAADLNATFSVAIVSTKVKCVQWRTNGMSIPTYAVWYKNDFPTNPNGNHAKMVKKVIGLNTTPKRTQAKLKPKYGGSLNKGMVTPIPSSVPTPKSTAPAPIPMPTPAPKKAAPKKVAKAVAKRKPTLRKSPTKKVAKKSVSVKKSPVKKKAAVKKTPSKKSVAPKKVGVSKSKKPGTKSLRSPSKVRSKSTGLKKKPLKKSPAKKSLAKPKLIKKVKG